MKCPVCQSTCFEEYTEGEDQCLDCLAIIDAKTKELLEVDGVRA